MLFPLPGSLFSAFSSSETQFRGLFSEAYHSLLCETLLNPGQFVPWEKDESLTERISMKLGVCEYVNVCVKTCVDVVWMPVWAPGCQPRQTVSLSVSPPGPLLGCFLQKHDSLLPVAAHHPRFSPITGCNIRTEVRFPLCVVFIQHSLMFPALSFKILELECSLFSSENTHLR